MMRMPTPPRLIRVPCPECGRRLRLNVDADVDLAVFLHTLDGSCSSRPKPPKIKGKSPATIRIVTLDEELEAIGW